MSSRVSLLKPLKGAQADASHPERQVWLSASAGTGKTHVLTARVLRLLLNGAAPDAILCLTFTKAGAAEMAGRIQSRLASWVRMREQDLRKELYALGEPNHDAAVAAARRLFARVLDAPGGGLRIQTIHAFSQALLAAFPVEAGLSPGFRPLDGSTEAGLVRATLARMLLSAEEQGDHGLIRDIQALSRRLGEQGAERYLVQCARAPLAFAALGSREAIEPRVRSGLGVPLGDVEAYIVAQIAAGVIDETCLRRIADSNHAWGTTRGSTRAGTVERWLAGSAAERAAGLADLHGVWARKDGELLSFGKGQAPQVEHYQPDCHDAHAACDALLSLRTRADLAAIIAAGLRAGFTFADAYAAAKRAAGAVDFDDLIRMAVGLIEQPGVGEWIRYKLDRRTDHVLIDEGQDTNAAQWRIVRALVDEFFTTDPGEDRAVRTLFSVGDFKQAIFGFQGTNPLFFSAARRHFTDAAEAGARALDWLSLDRSFRSAPAILEVVDRLLEALGPDELGLADPLEPHVSARGTVPGTVTLWNPISVATDVQDDEGEEGWLDDAQRLFATRLARQVRRWLDEGLWLPGKQRALRPEDVLILVRRRGDLAALIVARLNAENVPVAGVDRLRLGAPLAVKDLVAAIRFALQPEDDLTLANLLVSPLIGLSQEALYQIGFGRKGSLWAALSASEAHGDAVAALRAILASADFTTPYVFLETILSGPLDGRRKLLGRLGLDARDPIEELLNAALGFEGDATPTLQRFLDWFDRGEIEVTRDPSAPLDAVRVMTVHGAKGLQAPLVILADATGNPDQQPLRGLDWALEAGDEPLPVIRPRKAEMAGALAEGAAATERREREEHWRLLYVAATRAEERLVIGGALGPRAKGVPPPSSWYALFARVFDGLEVPAEDDPSCGAVRDYRGDVVESGRRAKPRGAAAQRLPLSLPAWLATSAPIEARPPRPLAPSAPEEDLAAMPPPTPAMRAAARRGKLLHALFERLPAVPPAERHQAAIRWLLGAGGAESEGEADAVAADACGVIGDPAYRAIFGPHALAEAPIAATLADGIVVAGTVDRLLVEEERVMVIDFKTGRAIPAFAEEVSANHLRQMAAYAAALGAIFPDRRIEAALLYTAGPMLLPLPPSLLDPHKPNFAPAQQKRVLGG